MNSHARLHGDCHQNYLLLLAHSPVLIKGEIIEAKGFHMKLEVVENSWGDLTPPNIDLDVFPNEEDVLWNGRTVFVFAEKVNDTLFSSGYDGCGILESRGDSVSLGRFYNMNPEVVSESDFLQGMRNIRNGKTSRFAGGSFSDTLEKVKEDFYKTEKKLDDPWWFFLVVGCVTAVQVMMFLGP